MRKPGKAPAKAKRRAKEPAQGKPPGPTGVNKAIPPARDMRKSAPGSVKAKANQRRKLA